MAQLRPEGVATFRDVQPRQDELPVACQELLRQSLSKVNKPAATIREAKEFTKEELRDHPADPVDGPPEEEVDVNEHEGQSVGKAKASHSVRKPEPAKQPAAPKPAPAAVPQAAVTGAPSPENVEEGTVRPVHQRGRLNLTSKSLMKTSMVWRGCGTCCSAFASLRASHTDLLGDGWRRQIEVAWTPN